MQAQPDEQIKKRIRFEAHDYFTPQPARGAAVYLLRFILHDNSDTAAVNILKSIVPALRPGDRIIINDATLPEPNTMPKGEERILRIVDLDVMAILNAREREVGEWKTLLARTSKRMKLRNVLKPQGSVISILEVVFE